MKLTRRHFIITTSTLFSGPIASPSFAQSIGDSQSTEPVSPVSNPKMWSTWDARVTPQNYDLATSNPWGLDTRFLPQRVNAKDGLRAGDVHVDAVARYVYLIEPEGTAMRYGVGIAKGNLYEPGVYSIKRKAKWPTWRPTQDMIEREPDKFEKFSNGVNGGPTNPLGSRALYLYEGNRDTYLRIHGTPQPRSIGSRASSGCVRMVMAHIIDLYDRVEKGSTAYLYPA